MLTQLGDGRSTDHHTSHTIHDSHPPFLPTSQHRLSAMPVTRETLSLREAAQLASHHDRDLRVRTLTSLLAALSSVNPESLESSTANIADSASVFRDDSGMQYSDLPPVLDSHHCSAHLGRHPPSRSNTFLKLLNYIAHVLVREHEIVAVLPKRSRRFNLFVAIDSSSDSEPDEWIPSTTTPAYLITRNPRSKSPDPPPQDITAQLQAISTEEDMLRFLHTYRHVPFRHHVQGIEILFNAIVDACNTRIALIPHSSQDIPADQLQLARDNLALRKNLLTLFVIFYSAGKMCRRFRSVLFQRFRMVMSNMLQEDVEAAVLKPPYSSRIPFTKFEINFFMSLFADPITPASTYPRLSALFSHPDNMACYSKQTAWELHRLLLSVLETASAATETLYTKIQSPQTTLMEISAAALDVRLWMARLQAMVHKCPASAAHIKALEPTFSPAIDGKVDMLNAPTETPTSDKFTAELDDNSGAELDDDGSAELDDDGGATDTTIEITLASKERRVGEECLWLITRYQTALDYLTAKKNLPKQSVRFTLCDVSAADVGVPKTDLHSWQDVITTLYPPLPDDIQPGDVYISSAEAIAALKDYGQRNRSGATHILRSPTHKFSGCWHAEAILGTLRHLSQLPASIARLPQDIDLTQFQNTFRTIGVSKRCCPICTKLLSLLGSRYGRCGSEPTATPMVLSCHQNVYATALPPYLPQDIAVALLEWLQALVKPLVDKLVRKRRRLSTESQRSTRSSDSKGDSPGKQAEDSDDEYCTFSVLGMTRTAV